MKTTITANVYTVWCNFVVNVHASMDMSETKSEITFGRNLVFSTLGIFGDANGIRMVSLTCAVVGTQFRAQFELIVVCCELPFVWQVRFVKNSYELLVLAACGAFRTKQWNEMSWSRKRNFWPHRQMQSFYIKVICEQYIRSHYSFVCWLFTALIE